MQFCNIKRSKARKFCVSLQAKYKSINVNIRTYMIQTQLLKADKPYQIISAAGMVGIQVATLIVTEEKIAEDGSYLIDTHSHPVVNYGNKEGLTEELKYHKNFPPGEEYKVYERLQPEGAVWNKVEIRDIRVLGLVGADNFPVDLEWFVSLVPSAPSEDPSVGPGTSPLWTLHTSNKIANLLFGMRRIGIPCATWTQDVSDHTDRDGHVRIYLKLDPQSQKEKLVTVQIREESEYNPLEGSIAFRVRLDENDPMECQYTIIRCMRELDDWFIKEGNNIKFFYQQSSATKDKWEDLLERCTEHINSVGWKNRYGLG